MRRIYLISKELFTAILQSVSYGMVRLGCAFGSTCFCMEAISV